MEVDPLIFFILLIRDYLRGSSYNMTKMQPKREA